MNNILQDIYDFEINFSISCFWDSGFEVKLGDETNGFKDEDCLIYGMDNVIKWLKEKMIEHYPDSDFAKKYVSEDEEPPIDPEEDSEHIQEPSIWPFNN